MLDAIERVLEYTAPGETAFRTDRKTQDAVLRNLETLGEAAKRVDEKTRARGAVAMTRCENHRIRPLTVRITLLDVEPAIWRLVQVDPELLLDDFHEVTQLTMGWRNRHLCEFEEPERADSSELLGPPRVWAHETMLLEGVPGLPLDETTVGEALNNPSRTLIYKYDFGDGWIHRIELVEGQGDGLDGASARLLRAAGACPPEDVGGTWGFADLKNAMAGKPLSPDTNLEPENLIEFANRVTGPWRDYDPDFVDIPAINRELEVRSEPPAEYQPDSLIDSLAHRVFEPYRVEFRTWVSRALDSAPSTIDDESVAEMTRPFRWLMNRIGDEGIKLTAAGYMPPVVVSDLMRELDWEEDWIGKMNREDQTFPAYHLRELSTRLRLIRKNRGRLVIKKSNRDLVDDPEELLSLIGIRLPMFYGESVLNHICLLLLIAIADGGYRDRDGYVTMLTGSLQLLGYSDRDGNPPDPETVGRAAIEVMDDLELLGLFRQPRYGRERDYRATEAGRAFARMAING